MSSEKLSSAQEWATGIQVCDAMVNGTYHSIASENEPSLLVQRITGNAIIQGGSVEHFSREMPICPSQTPAEKDLRPIDILYGCYIPATRSIKVFIDQIAQDAKLFNAETEELIEIVRIHEYAHAIAHLGVCADDIQNHLTKYIEDKNTNWSEFLNVRESWFSGFATELHEFVAQSITYAALSMLPASERFLKIFDLLEAKQPEHYKLSPMVKEHAVSANWPLVLKAARGEVDCLKRDDFVMREGLEALISDTSRRKAK